MSETSKTLTPADYDASINWTARIRRERPVLKKVFGPPGDRPILDAGCGPGRQAVALARCRYRVVGVDRSAQMLEFARSAPGGDSSRIQWVRSEFSQLTRRCAGPFAGIYCIGNSLSATGTTAAVRSALRNFAAVLHPTGRLFVQVLNSLPMRETVPCVRGPVHIRTNGTECVRVRMFDFSGSRATVTNINLIRDGEWRVHAMRGRLCVFDAKQLRAWCREAGLRVEEMWGSYAGEPFDPRKSADLIIIARRSRRSA